MHEKRAFEHEGNILLAAAAVLATVLSGLGFNAYRQAHDLSGKFRAGAQIAVFIAPDSKSSLEVIMEKLANLEGVERADLVSKEKALEKVQSESPQMKNILLSGDNPFNPYFTVAPRKASVAGVNALQGMIAGIEGVSEVLFDAKIFEAAEKTEIFSELYAFWGKAAAFAVFMIIAARFMLRWFNNTLSMIVYMKNLLLGIVSGAAGAGLFFIITRKFVQTDVISLPAGYIPYFVLTGLLTVLLLENDQG